MPYKHGRPVIDLSIFFRIACYIATYMAIPVGFTVSYFQFFTRIKNRFRLKKVKKAITVSNHTTFFDPVKVALLVQPEFMYQTFMEATAEAPFVGTLCRLLGGVPIPRGKSSLRKIQEICEHSFKYRRFLHFYPEGECYLYNQKINEFKLGAFKLAAELDIPVVPLVSVLHEGPFKAWSFWGRSIPFETFVVLEPVYPSLFIKRNEDGEIQTETLREFAEAVRAAMQAEIDKRGGTNVFSRGQMKRLKGIND